MRNRNGVNMDKVVLDRALYKQIKGMDRDKMADYLSNIYMSGKNDVEEVSVDVDKMRADIAAIKGIGESRLNEIMSVIMTHIGKDNTDAED